MENGILKIKYKVRDCERLTLSNKRELYLVVLL